ncbi:amino acid ABC transporter permease [Phyllobacterium sp. LjRoot231]|uniref:amino acid ABC transporter permease n=1 Tax=Phyllobacterium sp. LjRoot231 TaxID=3342289 RepID=UPI003ED08886
MQFVLGNQGLQWSDAYYLLQGAINTLVITAAAGLLGTLIGIPLGWARASSKIARILTAPLIDVLRSVPLIIQLILLNSIMSLAGLGMNAFWLGTIVLAAWMATVTSEVSRAGFSSVPPTYRRSARSLGMNYIQELTYVSAPLAFRTGLTSWIGLLLSLAKDSALVSVIGYIEFMRASQVLITRTHETWLLLAGVGLFYFLICYPVSRYSRRLERKVSV